MTAMQQSHYRNSKRATTVELCEHHSNAVDGLFLPTQRVQYRELFNGQRQRVFRYLNSFKGEPRLPDQLGLGAANSVEDVWLAPREPACQCESDDECSAKNAE